MATLFTKSLIVLGGLTGISATSGGIYYLTSKNNKKVNIDSVSNPITVVEKDKTIASLLTSKALIESGADGSKWNATWDLFKKEHSSNPPVAPWEFANWDANEQGTINFDSFKSQCLKLGKEKVSGTEDPVFIQVEKYCSAQNG